MNLKNILIAGLIIILLIGCNKVTENNLKKIDIGMSRKQVESTVGKGNKGRDFYNDGKFSWLLAYQDGNLSAMTIVPDDKSKNDSTISLGLLSDWQFSLANSQGVSLLNSVSIGGFEIIFNDSTKFIAPIESENELIQFGMLKSHIFRITGPQFVSGNSLKQIAKKVEDVTSLKEVK